MCNNNIQRNQYKMICSINELTTKWLYLTLVILIRNDHTSCFVLRAYISQHGLHGEIEFSHKNQSVVSIRTNLDPTLEFPDQIWRWSVHEFPVDYSDITDERCSESNLGKEVINLTDELGYLVIPGKDHSEFESKNELTGNNGFWGKSMVLRTAENNRVICASIVSTDKSFEKMAVAHFKSPIAGSMFFRWISAREFDESDSYIHTDLYHSKAVPDKTKFTEHKWKLFVTDVFDSKRESFEDNCNALQLVFDPDNQGDNSGLGDLDTRLGKIKVAVDRNLKRTKTLYKDGMSVIPADLEASKRNLYMVIFDSRHPESFLACAKVRYVHPKSAKVLINMDGVRGQIEFTQRSQFDPTWAHFQLATSDMDYESSLRFISSVRTYSVHELSVRLYDESNVKTICKQTGAIYNPRNLNLKDVPPAGLGTQDQYAIGDLLGKYKKRTEYLNHKYLLPGVSSELSGSYWDVFLPLQGVRSVSHRSVVISRKDKLQDICGTILHYDYDTGYKTRMSNAEVVFRYPLVGKIILRQPEDRPYDDTTIIIEGLIHADGSNINNTFSHRWAIHENAPGADFYNWTARCLSAGKLYDPYQIDTDTMHPEHYCQFGQEGLCRIGDLTTRHGTLSVSGKKRDSDRLTRRLFTDSVINLSGRYSVMRKSIVIYDDHGPVARGERMACSIVAGLYRRKAVARDWFGNGAPVPVQGRLEMSQQSQYDITDVTLDVEGLVDVSSYQIHVAPVVEELEFPCESTTLYDTYNPFKIHELDVPMPMKGTPDQYELGDLSSKYGSLEGYKKISTFFNETQLTLFGLYSVIGRSVVFHKKSKQRSWACGSIERGYSPSEAREIRAIASFHHPGGFAYGYIRMTQLIYNDNSQSDTIIEVSLRHPGVMDRNVTLGHNWEVWVNPVGVDAAVKVTHTRCVAGGYRWNPYYTQLADPLNHDLYYQECGADNPLRCHVGDLSSRLGPISVGSKRQMFVDSNLPLEGTFSAVGRSVVIMGPGRKAERFACANIEPDKDIVKFANIAKPPKFVISQFMEEMRQVLGAPEWMVTLDSRKTRTLHNGGCVQLLMHFKGPHANKLELDFARLMASGRLDRPTISVAGFVNAKRRSSLSYRQCGAQDPNERKTTRFYSLFSSNSASSKNQNLYLNSYFCILLIFLSRL